MGAATQGALVEAADYLAKPGNWLQGGAQFGPACCAVRAIGIFASDEATRMDALDRARRAAGAASLWVWNDTPGRTQAQVVATLRKAAQAEGASQ